MTNRHDSSNKIQLRRETGKRRETLSPETRRQADADIRRRLRELPELQNCRLLAAYVASGAEPDLGPFLKEFALAGGKLFLPRSARNADDELIYELARVEDFEKGLVVGAYGIMEPAAERPAAEASELSELSWLAPGVAFDVQCHRLGRGKGFYDRLLDGAHGLRIGVFYECQKVAAVPVERHDQVLDLAVTEANVYRREKPLITEIA